MKMGMKWPVPRFIDNGDGTVMDRVTGLVWLKNANCFGRRNWKDAIKEINDLADGHCGLSDGSKPGDWRLPNVRELQSLTDCGIRGFALPSGHPFIGVQTIYYWSSSIRACVTLLACLVSMSDGQMHYSVLSHFLAYNVWPVRSGD